VKHDANELPNANLPPIQGGKGFVTGGVVVGVIGLLLTLVLGLRSPRETLTAYLIAFCYWTLLSVGGLTLVLANHAARAKWNVTVRRIGENMGAAIPIFALLFLPLLFGAKHVWFWVQPQGPISDEMAKLLEHKRPYLNMFSFTVRTLVYLVIWSAYSIRLRQLSLEQDRTGDPMLTVRMRSISPFGLVLFVLSVTFAAFDWLMSLQPTWYSTIFGLYVYAGAFLAAMAVMCIVVTGLRASKSPWGHLITVDQQHNLGKLLFAFTCFWAYMSFSQYMLIWAGNLPEELIWIVNRSHGVWRPVGQLILIGQFVIPFFLLLSRDLKRNTTGLAAVAAWILVIHYVDVYWIVMPAFDYNHIGLTFAHVTSMLGIGGISVATMAWLLRQHAPVPTKDPFLEDSLRYVQP
jgi:hypothetical protein